MKLSFPTAFKQDLESHNQLFKKFKRQSKITWQTKKQWIMLRRHRCGNDLKKTVNQLLSVYFNVSE